MLSILEKLTYLYPPSTITAHVSDVTNHQTNRIIPFHTVYYGEIVSAYIYGEIVSAYIIE